MRKDFLPSRDLTKKFIEASDPREVRIHSIVDGVYLLGIGVRKMIDTSVFQEYLGERVTEIIGSLAQRERDESPCLTIGANGKFSLEFLSLFSSLIPLKSNDNRELYSELYKEVQAYAKKAPKDYGWGRLTTTENTISVMDIPPEEKFPHREKAKHIGGDVLID